ncbi:MAG TPA: hypothetical protein VFB34_05165 [Chloroflexota bacterium]|nr:hypothetical protein [Chloroflexota bacterium]
MDPTDEGILRVMGTGLRDAAIATHLSWSAHNVKRRIEAVMRRHELQTRFQLGLWAHDYGYSRLDSE